LAAPGDVVLTGAERTHGLAAAQQIAKRLLNLEVSSTRAEQAIYFRSDHFSFAHGGNAGVFPSGTPPNSWEAGGLRHKMWKSTTAGTTINPRTKFQAVGFTAVRQAAEYGFRWGLRSPTRTSCRTGGRGTSSTVSHGAMSEQRLHGCLHCRPSTSARPLGFLEGVLRVVEGDPLVVLDMRASSTWAAAGRGFLHLGEVYGKLLARDNPGRARHLRGWSPLSSSSRNDCWSPRSAVSRVAQARFSSGKCRSGIARSGALTPEPVNNGNWNETPSCTLCAETSGRIGVVVELASMPYCATRPSSATVPLSRRAFPGPWRRSGIRACAVPGWNRGRLDGLLFGCGKAGARRSPPPARTRSSAERPMAMASAVSQCLVGLQALGGLARARPSRAACFSASGRRGLPAPARDGVENLVKLSRPFAPERRCAPRVGIQVQRRGAVSTSSRLPTRLRQLRARSFRLGHRETLRAG